MTTQRNNRFQLGDIYITPGAKEAMEILGEDFAPYLDRHVSGDWGLVCSADRAENEFALEHELRILSVFQLRDETKIWIITEADRSSTTILLPDEY